MSKLSLDKYLFIYLYQTLSMALKSFVDDARNTNKKMKQLTEQKVGTSNTIIDISDGQGIPKDKLDDFRSKQTTGLPNEAKKVFRTISSNKPKTDFEKQYLARTRETISQPGNIKQTVTKDYCNIVANVIKQSGTATRGDTTWKCCKYKKEVNGIIYCTEYHSLCGKERCKRATK
jgi:hypothetical protein